MSDPGRIRAWQWVLWAVIQVACIWGAIAAYGSMNQGGYHAGRWALIVSVPLVVLPLIYGWSLVEGARAYAKYQRRIPVVHPIPIPPCDICGANACSWNTRLGEWAETCRKCRNPDYFDNPYMIG